MSISQNNCLKLSYKLSELSYKWVRVKTININSTSIKSISFFNKLSIFQ